MTSLERILTTPLRAERRGGYVAVKVAADGYHVATVSPGMNDAGDYARLFAAAPEMLKALQAIRDGLADTGSTPDQRMTTITKADAHRIAIAAIAKAEDRS